MSVDISGLSKGAVLAALYNASRPVGMGFLHFNPEPMTEEQANAIIAKVNPSYLAFDYLKGRVMKVNLTDDEFNPGGYDRDNGNGAAERAIAPLRRAAVA